MTTFQEHFFNMNSSNVKFLGGGQRPNINISKPNPSIGKATLQEIVKKSKAHPDYEVPRTTTHKILGWNIEAAGIKGALEILVYIDQDKNHRISYNPHNRPGVFVYPEGNVSPEDESKFRQAIQQFLGVSTYNPEDDSESPSAGA